MERVVPLVERDSGYAGRPEQWVEFLQCWSLMAKDRHDAEVRRSGASPYLPVLSKFVRPSALEPSSSEISEEIARLENRLRVSLPKSYRDFLLAYRPPPYEPYVVPWGVAEIGFLAPSQVDRLAVIDPELVAIIEGVPGDAPDADYFKYGIHQDDVMTRSSQKRDAIVVGRYEDHSTAFVLLYPNLRTHDGEMEAAMYLNGGESRAPSFAELMRQLSYMETHKIDHVPPYAQTLLKGTCADKLPLVDVWWE